MALGKLDKARMVAGALGSSAVSCGVYAALTSNKEGEVDKDLYGASVEIAKYKDLYEYYENYANEMAEEKERYEDLYKYYLGYADELEEQITDLSAELAKEKASAANARALYEQKLANACTTCQITAKSMEAQRDIWIAKAKAINSWLKVTANQFKNKEKLEQKDRDLASAALRQVW